MGQHDEDLELPELRRISLEEGEVLWANVDHPVSEEQGLKLRKLLASQLGLAESRVVVTFGVELAAVRPDEAAFDAMADAGVRGFAAAQKLTEASDGGRGVLDVEQLRVAMEELRASDGFRPTPVGLPDPPASAFREVGLLEDREVAELANRAIIEAQVGALHPRQAAALRVAYARARGLDGTIFDRRLWDWIGDQLDEAVER